MSADLSKKLNEQKQPEKKKEPLKLRQKIALGILIAASVAFIVLFVMFPDSFFAILAVYFIVVMVFNCLFNSGFTAETTVFYILCCGVTFGVHFAFCSVKRNTSNFEASLYANAFFLAFLGYSFLYNIKSFKHNKLYTQTVEGTFKGYYEYEVSDSDDIHPQTTKMYQRVWEYEFNNNTYTVKGLSDTSEVLSKGSKQKLIINTKNPLDFCESGKRYGKKQFIRAWVLGIIPLAIGVFILLDMMGII